MNPVKKGDTVAIINCTLGGRYLVEAKRARVVGVIEEGPRPYCRVRIGNQYVDRFIDPDAQADPEAFAAGLNGQVQS